MGRLRQYVLLFVCLSALYHSNLRPIAAGDSLGASLIPFSVTLDRSLSLDRFGPYLQGHTWYGGGVVHQSGGHWYSLYPIAGPLFISPLYIPVVAVPRIRHLSPGAMVAIARVLEKFAAVALAAAAVLALLSLLLRIVPPRQAWLLALVFALATGNWSTSSQALWQHTFGQLAIIGCLCAIERFGQVRWYWMAGICAACAVAIRPTNILLLPALALAIWLRGARWRDVTAAFLPSAVAAILVAAYNLMVFDRLAGGYPVPLNGPFLAGLAGILFSPGRGLLIYTPVVLFALTAFAPKSRAIRQKYRPLIAASAAFPVLQIALVAMWPAWWGGYCWGPRLLTEILAPLMVLIAIGLPALWKRAFIVAAIYGCLIQALGVYCYPKGHWDATPVSVNDDPSRLWNWSDNPVVRTARGGVAWEPYAIVGAFATGGPGAAVRKLGELGINPY